MKNILKSAALLCVFAIMFSCNNINRNGANESSEGTTTTNAVNGAMEDERTSVPIDTLASPGSNAMDSPSSGTTSNKGTGATTGNENAGASAPTSSPNVDKNMKGQSSTHGKDTKTGDY